MAKYSMLPGQAIFGAICLMVGYLTAEARTKAGPTPCKVVEKKVEAYPRTKAEMAAFIKTHREQGKGWIR